MPIAFRAASATDTAGVATPTAAIPLPSGWQPGDLHLLVINLKSSTVTVTTPTGWTAEANSNITGGAGTVGVDAGPNRVAVFWRIADVGDTAPTVTLSATPNAYQARILGFTKAANEAWDTPLFSGAGDTTGSATSYGTVTGNVTLPLQAGDWLGQATGLNGDAGTPGTRTFAAPGVTLGTYAAHVADVGTTQGGDLRYDIGTAPYSSGTATGAPTLARTWTTGSASLAGATVFWRLRTQVPLPYTYDFTGTTGAAWAEEWTTTPGVTIQSNAGQLVTPAASYQSRSAHLAKMTSTADVDIRLTVTFTVVTEFYFAVNVRSPDGVMSGGDPLYSPFVNDGMVVLFMNDGNVELDRCVAGVRTGLTGVNIVSGGLVSGTAYTVRFQAVGTTMRAKIWVAGNTEPSTWLEFVDSSAVTSAGRVVIGYASGSAATAMTATVDDLSVEPGVLGPPSGTATGSWQFTGTASGKRTPQATAGGTWSFSGVASGRKSSSGTAAGSWSFSGTAVGKRIPRGTASGSWTYAGTATGQAPTVGPASGTATGTWSFSGAASGTRVPKASATGSWTFTSAAAGKRTPKGTATGTWTFAGAAAGVAPAKVGAFVEHFNTANSSVWSGWSANIGVSNGRASLLASSSYDVLSTIGTYDLTNSSLTGEFSRFAGKGSSVETYLGVFTDGGDQVAFHGDGNNNLSFDVYTGGTPNNTYQGVGLMTKHRIWRIRESAGTIYWETGPDGLNWTVWRTMATPFNVSSVHVFLKVGYWDPADAPNVTVPALVEGINLTYAQPSTPRTFYVDTAGSDTADGSSTTPWATLARAEQVPLYPGDTIALKRGGTWSEEFHFIGMGTSGAPITLTAYGSGAQPIIAGGGSAVTPIGVRRPLEVYGSYPVIDGIEVQGSSDYDMWVYAPDTTVQNCTVRWGSYGILSDAAAERIRILDNDILDVNGIITPPGDNDDTGAMGILLAGDSPVIAGNYISGCWAPSPDYEVDGGAVEIYGAANGQVYNNVAVNCTTFCEIGLVGSDNNVIHHNTFVSSGISAGVVCNGTAAFGPVLGTVFHHNTVVITGGVHNCHGCYVAPGADLDFRNNIIVVTGNGFQISAFGSIIEAGNVLYGDSVRVTLPSGQSLSATDYFGNPQFVTPYTDLHLLTGSPAINRGVTGLGYTTDLDGAAIVGAPDSGAYEFAGANTGSATGSWSFTGAAVGKRTPKATATGAWTFLGDATGRALLPPTGLTVTPVSTTQLNLSWNSVSGATGYDIERDGVVILTDHLGTTYSDTGLSEATAHTYRVRAAG